MFEQPASSGKATWICLDMLVSDKVCDMCILVDQSVQAPLPHAFCEHGGGSKSRLSHCHGMPSSDGQSGKGNARVVFARVVLAP